MRITVEVKTGSRTEVVEEIGKRSYFVRTCALPEKGKANERVAEQLADHFKVSKSQVTLAHGETSRIKYFDVQL